MKIKFENRHFMIVFLSILAVIGMFQYGFLNVFVHVAVGTLAAAIVDVLINYFKYKRFLLSPSSFITGLIVSEVLSFDLGNHLLIVAIASSLAIISKHVIIYQKRHIFNPASFGIILVSLIFSSAISWWAASNIWIIAIFGLLMLYRLKKYKLTLSYLIMHSLIVSVIAFVDNTSWISNLQLTNLYFVAFMIIEPITSPVKKKARMVYGSLVAIISIPILFLIPATDHSILGLLIANMFARMLDKRLG